ncbi:MAG TPA: phosphoribosylaminoimidazolesuccinocarboxamide synthase, partial [bacterium]|nr:phosphoribosylaminoimidazolesuccinocarboxamide synthase [bacterium]
MQAYQEPGLPFKKIYSGKVRDLYEVDRQTWLIVATDRISAFDFI